MKIQRVHFRLQLSDVYCTQAFLQDRDPRSVLPFEVWAVWPLAHSLFYAKSPWYDPLSSFQGWQGPLKREEGKQGSGCANWANWAVLHPWSIGRKEDAAWNRGWGDAEHTQLWAEVLPEVAGLWGPQPRGEKCWAGLLWRECLFPLTRNNTNWP